MKAGRPLILTRTQAQLTLGSGAVLQNNDNQVSANTVDSYLPVGGAIQISDGILSLNGGEIKDCNSAFFGGAAHIRGSSTFTAKAGTVSGNNAGGYAAICLDNAARSIVEGGEFSNNKSGNNGGVFWLKDGMLSITGGTFENNSTDGKGGVAYQDKASASVSLKGGVFRNNRAKGDGGVLYTPNGLSISGGSYEGNSSGGNGGAVWTNGTLSISGGSFRSNTAQKGAAVYQEGGKEVTITGFEETQEIYLKTLGKITVQNELKGKRLPLQTESAVTDGMTVATLMVARPQEYGAVTTLNGNTVLPVKDGTAGWFLKVDQAAQVCTVTYHVNDGSIQDQSNYESYRVGVGLTLPIPTKEGFLFRGWYPTADFSGEAVTAIGSDAAGDKTYYAKWEKDEPLVDAAKPAAITLTDVSYEVGKTAEPLNGTTTAADGGTITYQWYEATSKGDQDGTLLEGKTTPTFTPDTDAVGTHFYYVVATNTNANATGEKTAETRSNTVQITVQEPAPVKSFIVRYEWNGEAPSDANLPQDDRSYDTEEQARAAMDKTYTASSTSNAQKDGKDGTWTFSGWTATVENTVVKFTGKWTFTETPVRPGRPSSGGSSDRDRMHSIFAPGYITGGAVSTTPTVAAKGTTVTIAVKPDDGHELSKLTATDQSGNRLSLNDQGDGKYTFTMPDGKVSVDASFSKIAATINFRDVNQSDYYYDAVQWAVEKGITEGTSATTFSPDASCTRAQMVTFLWRAAGSPAPKSTVNPFTDVSASDYYYNAVLWAVENGITTGVSADRFAPGATVSRAQTVTFLYRANGSPAANGASFSDVAADECYANAVAWAVQNGITTDTGNGKFAPNAPCTRGQIVTFLYRSSK